MEDTQIILNFRVVETGQFAYILWPWETPEDFLYEAFQWGATYKIRMPIPKPTQQSWIEIVPVDGVHGEYTQGLFFGLLDWGYALYRRFNARGSHYLTQHGLDGIPKKIWDAAYEYWPRRPTGVWQFQFRVETKGQGAFDLTHYDWIQHFVSGRNEHISRMGISIKKVGGTQ